MALRSLVSAASLAVAAVFIAAIGSSQAVSSAEAFGSDPFAGLSGAWTGEGAVAMNDGSRERIRCRATYTVTPAGRSLNQGLRCASDSYTFDVRSSVFADASGALSGTWSEQTRQVAGDLTGRASPGHIETSVSTIGFSANLTITTHGSRQSVSLAPQGTEVQAVTIEMRRI